MYRTITLYFLRNHINWIDTNQVNNALQYLTLTFKFNDKTQQSEIYLNEENVEYVIRT